MKTLVFDTETTGFPLWKARVDDPRQPHIVSLAAILLDDGGREVQRFARIVDPGPGVEFSPAAVAVHGIDAKRAKEEGIPLKLALAAFRRLFEQADEGAAYHLAFDKRMFEIAFVRVGYPVLMVESGEVWRLWSSPAGQAKPSLAGEAKPMFCAMEEVKSLINLRPTEKMRTYGIFGPKTPNLAEAYAFLFGQPIPDAHDALGDARGAARIWTYLRKTPDQPPTPETVGLFAPL